MKSSQVNMVENVKKFSSELFICWCKVIKFNIYFLGPGLSTPQWISSWNSGLRVRCFTPLEKCRTSLSSSLSFQLPIKSVEVGWECLQDEFHKLIEAAKKRKDHDDIFDQVKGAVVETAISKHVWEDKAAEVLKVIQLNTLEDRWERYGPWCQLSANKRTDQFNIMQQSFN